MDKKKIYIPDRLTQQAMTPLEEQLEVPYKNAKLYIGIPKERSFQENRIALTPAAGRPGTGACWPPRGGTGGRWH